MAVARSAVDRADDRLQPLIDDANELDVWHQLAGSVRAAGRSTRWGIGRSTRCGFCPASPSNTLATSTVLVTVAVSWLQR
jgi:hypothetical protein